MKPAKPLVVRTGTSPARAWFSWWCRYRLPLLSSRRLYVTDVDGLLWLIFDYRGYQQPQPRALLEIVPMGGNLDARRASLAALRELGRLSGLPVFVVEVDHRRKQFRVRTADRVLIFIGGGEKEFVEWLLHAIETHGGANHE